jgi:hypothetical protein
MKQRSSIFRSGRRSAVLPAVAFLLVACGGGENVVAPQASERPGMRALSVPAQQPVFPIPLSNVAAGENDVISVDGLTKIAERRISRTVYEYDFKLRVSNRSSNSIANVKINILAVGRGSHVVDPLSSIDQVSANSEVLSSDTVTIRHDRAFAFAPADVRYNVQYSIATALDLLDRSDSIGGVDANKNGMRDDVEQFIASMGLDEGVKPFAERYGIALQQIVAAEANGGAGPMQLDAYKKALACLSGVSTDWARISRSIVIATANTPTRSKYLSVFEARSLPQIELNGRC